MDPRGPRRVRAIIIDQAMYHGKRIAMTWNTKMSENVTQASSQRPGRLDQASQAVKARNASTAESCRNTWMTSRETPSGRQPRRAAR